MARFPLTVWAILLGATAWAQDSGVRRLGSELTSPDVAIRRQAAIGLGRAGGAEAVTMLRRRFSSEPEVAIRLEIVRVLRNMVFLRSAGYREALTGLGVAADDEVEQDEHVRLRATEALWEAGKKNLVDPVPLLERSLDDRSSRLRVAAVKMLRKLGTPQVIPVLGRAAVDRSQPETVRLRAVDALGAVPVPDLGPVGRQVEKQNLEVAGMLAMPPRVNPEVLERRHQRQIAYLVPVVGDVENSPALMLAAVKSIGRIKDKSAIPILRHVGETHPHAAVRKQAAQALSHVLARQYE